MFTTLLLVFNSYYKFLNQWISLTNAWLWPPQTFQNPQIKIFDQIDIKEKGTIFHIFSGGNLWYNLKNSGENLSLFQCNYVISKVNAKQNKMTSYFFLSLNHVNLTGKRTALSISWATIALWYLNNWGESYWLIEWTYFLYCCCLIFFCESFAEGWLCLLSDRA